MAVFTNSTIWTEEALNRLGLKDLQEAFEQVTGTSNRSPNRKYLTRTILKTQADGTQKAEAPTYEGSIRATAEAPELTDRELVDRGLLANPDEEDPLDGKTPQEVIEEAKARGRAKIAKAEAAEASETKPKRESDGLAVMDAAALQALYLKEIGRPTGSDNLGYLVWKIREARKGKIKVGPATPRAPKSDKPVKVIPIRIEEDALAAMDELIGKGKPYSSRMDIFRQAITVWADMAGHEALSNLIVGVRTEAAAK